MTTTSPKTKTAQVSANRLRGQLDLIMERMAREAERERRAEADYRAGGRYTLAEAAYERAYAYECILAYAEGVTGTPARTR